MNTSLNHDTSQTLPPGPLLPCSPTKSEGVSQPLSRQDQNNLEALCQCWRWEDKVGRPGLLAERESTSRRTVPRAESSSAISRVLAHGPAYRRGCCAWHRAHLRPGSPRLWAALDTDVPMGHGKQQTGSV